MVRQLTGTDRTSNGLTIIRSNFVMLGNRGCYATSEFKLTPLTTPLSSVHSLRVSGLSQWRRGCSEKPFNFISQKMIANEYNTEAAAQGWVLHLYSSEIKIRETKPPLESIILTSLYQVNRLLTLRCMLAL